jgi:hypothetical protein
MDRLVGCGVARGGRRRREGEGGGVGTLGAHTHSKRLRTIAGEGKYMRPNTQRTNAVLFCIILPAK